MIRTTVNTLSEGEVSEIAASIIGERLRPFGFEDVTVADEEDFDGIHILRMIAQVRDKVPADRLIDTIDAVRTALLKRGEDRFVYLSARSGTGNAAGNDGEDAV